MNGDEFFNVTGVTVIALAIAVRATVEAVGYRRRLRLANSTPKPHQRPKEVVEVSARTSG